MEQWLIFFFFFKKSILSETKFSLSYYNFGLTQRVLLLLFLFLVVCHIVPIFIFFYLSHYINFYILFYLPHYGSKAIFNEKFFIIIPFINNKF